MLTVRLPRTGNRDTMNGVAALPERGSALKARVRAAAIDGAANNVLVQPPARNRAVAAGEVSPIGAIKGTSEHNRYAPWETSAAWCGTRSEERFGYFRGKPRSRHERQSVRSDAVLAAGVLERFVQAPQ